MMRFIKSTVIYLFLLFSILLLGLFATSAFVDRQVFGAHQTDSNLLVLGEGQAYDLLLMGISHARNFSRHQNHSRMEQRLNKRIANLGQGNGTCGINEQLFYLDYFYNQKNTAQTLVYVISPPLFFSESLALSSNTFDKEPFNWDFLQQYWTFPTENRWERIVSYLQTKYSPRWILHRPFSLEEMDQQLEKLDTRVVAEGQKLAYGDTLNTAHFQKSIIRLEETIKLALKQDTKVILVIPPALFGQWKGHQEVVRFAKEMMELDEVEFYDFSESMLEPKYYYDHHHLNTSGVIFFTEKYLKPIVD